uniref:Tetratricopeptide repeat protein n=1 Tax=Haptolina brevifila TaxID=156173 RepID=A0A7S2IJS5_9EUKA
MSRVNKNAKKGAVVIRERQNWLIHMQYTRQECVARPRPPQMRRPRHAHRFLNRPHRFFHRPRRYDVCLQTIEQQLKDCRGMAEYPIYIKALIKRQRGEINESLQLFQAATCLNPNNIANLKQVGRSLYLLARHKAALDVYEEALRISVDDWEIWHNKGAP